MGNKNSQEQETVNVTNSPNSILDDIAASYEKLLFTNDSNSATFNIKTYYDLINFMYPEYKNISYNKLKFDGSYRHYSRCMLVCIEIEYFTIGNDAIILKHMVKDLYTITNKIGAVYDDKCGNLLRMFTKLTPFIDKKNDPTKKQIISKYKVVDSSFNEKIVDFLLKYKLYGTDKLENVELTNNIQIDTKTVYIPKLISKITNIIMVNNVIVSNELSALKKNKVSKSGDLLTLQTDIIMLKDKIDQLKKVEDEYIEKVNDEKLENMELYKTLNTNDNDIYNKTKQLLKILNDKKEISSELDELQKQLKSMENEEKSVELCIENMNKEIVNKSRYLISYSIFMHIAEYDNCLGSIL